MDFMGFRALCCESAYGQLLIFEGHEGLIWTHVHHHMVVSQNRGDPNIDPQYTIVLIMGTPNRVPLISGNPHMGNGDCSPHGGTKAECCEARDFMCLPQPNIYPIYRGHIGVVESKMETTILGYI